MIVERAEHPTWTSNAYLVADGPGGHGVLVDGNGVTDPLLRRIERDGITITHILNTHHHSDHVVDNDEYRRRFGAPLVAHPFTAAEIGGADEEIDDGATLHSGDLEIRAIHTPGHAAGHLAFLIDGTDCFTADVLFKGTVGGTRAPGHTTFADLRSSIMDRLMALDPSVRVHPGHTLPTTIGDEWERNPFIRIWRGLDEESDEPCTVRGEPARLVLWAPDYDGTNKAWVRFPATGDDIVGGSQVERG
jgi:glyoxylase-like metal-dependent hydrolase (beta-lactamase superfamily II)